MGLSWYGVLLIVVTKASGGFGKCWDRSNQVRQDGSLCFELPPWQHRPVSLEDHLQRMQAQFNTTSQASAPMGRRTHTDSEVSRYMDTVLAPFLDTYHRNIQSAYQQLTGKMLKRIKEETSAAQQRKRRIYDELSGIAERLQVPPLCDEERRDARTLASRHVARTAACVEEARASIARMAHYADDMVALTDQHMRRQSHQAHQRMQAHPAHREAAISSCLKSLSHEAIALGYELGLSLTNGRRHSDQSCERLTACIARVRRASDQAVADLTEQLEHCVYA